MKTLGYYNGVFAELEQMYVPMLDRACYFGDGVYDATYSRNYKIYSLDEHIERFSRSAELMNIELPISRKSLSQLLNDLIKLVDNGNQFVYWQVTRGCELRNHTYEKGVGNLWIMLKPKEIENIDKRLKLITTKDNRYTLCNIKSLNLIPNIMAAQLAKICECDEAIFYRGDRVTECAHSNIHIIKNDVLITPPTDNFILAGVQRAHLIKACEHLKLPVEIRPFTLSELKQADEIIVTSAGSLCLRVIEIDDEPVGGKAENIIVMLQNYLYSDFIEATN